MPWEESWTPDACPPPVLRVQEPGPASHGSGGLDVSDPPLALLCHLLA